jgi:hypothetical protein
MKKYFSIIIVLLLLSNISFSQHNKNDSIPIFINDSIFVDDYSNRKEIGLIGMTPFDNYSNQKEIAPANRSFFDNHYANKIAAARRVMMYPNMLPEGEKMIVIIDNKIFNVDDKEFKELDKSNIKTMNFIKDENSKTEIKYVIIITTK